MTAERELALTALKERLKERFSKWDGFNIEDDENWLGVGSLPHWPRMVIEEAERSIRYEYHTTLSYMELGVAFMTAMHELGKLSANGKGEWIYSPLRATQGS